MKALAEIETGGKEKAGEGVVPYAGGGEVDSEGIDGPEAGGKGGGPVSECIAGAQVERDAGESGEETVNREDSDSGGGGVDAEDAKDRCEKVRIEGRDEGGGAGCGPEGGAEAVALGDGAGDPAHLPPEIVEVVAGVDGLAEDAGDEDEAEDKGGEDNDGKPGGRRLPPKRLGIRVDAQDSRLSDWNTPTTIERGGEVSMFFDVCLPQTARHLDRNCGVPDELARWGASVAERFLYLFLPFSCALLRTKDKADSGNTEISHCGAR